MRELARLSAIVHGRVQGVFFRDFTYTQATALGLTGFARNRLDGTVEAVAEGSKEDLERLLGQIRVGPPAAQVARVDVQWQDPSGEFGRFEVRYR